MALADEINMVLRDFERVTARDPAPHGDPTSGVHDIEKGALRQLLLLIAQTMGDPSALQTILTQVAGKADLPNSGKTFVSRAAAESAGQAALPSTLGQIETREGDYLVLRSPTATADDPLFETAPRWGVVGRYPSRGVVEAAGIITLTGVGGTATTITATADAAPGNGKRYQLTPLHDSTGATTLSINGGGAMTIRDSEGVTLAAKDLKAGVPVQLLQTATSEVRIMALSLAKAAGAGGLLAAGADLNAVTEPGTYYGSGSFSNSPITSASLVLKVSVAGAGNQSLRRRVLQELTVDHVTNGWRSWFRVIDADNPATARPWFPVHYDPYQGAPTAPDLNTLTTLGTNVISAGFTNGPADYPHATGLMEVTTYGTGFLQQALRGTGNASDDGSIWTRVIRPSTSVFSEWRKIGTGGTPGMPLAGKKIVFLGDSITESYDLPSRIASRLGATGINGGFGGTRLTEMTDTLAGMCGVDVAEAIATGSWAPMEAAAQIRFEATGDDNRPIVARLKAVDWGTVDYIASFWGTNDFNNAVPLGADTENNRTSIRGGVNRVVQRILTAHPHIKMVWIAPMFRARQSVGDGKDSDSTPNTAGLYLVEYADAIREAAARHHLPALDLYRTSGIGPLNYAHYLQSQTIDGLHPGTEPGKQLVSGRIAGFLESLA